MQTPPENFPSGTQPFSTPATLDPFEIEDEIQPEYFHIGGGPFFHGTSRRAARKILKEGFRDWSWTMKNSRFRSFANERDVPRIGDGHYGRGIHITRSWQRALAFGPSLFRVSVRPGTRILRLDVPLDGRVLGLLRRELGDAILTEPPRKALPKNRHFTLHEAVQLVRFHVNRWEQTTSPWLYACSRLHEPGLLDLRDILIRHGIQGWGEPAKLSGLVLFAMERITLREVVLSIPKRTLLSDFGYPGYAEDQYPSLGAFVEQCRKSINRGNTVTRKWVDQANADIARSKQNPHGAFLGERRA